MEIILRGEHAARAEDTAVQLVWDYHTAVQEELGEAEIARRRAAYDAFVQGAGHDPLGDR